MKRLSIAALVLAFAAGEGSALERFDISKMSCDQVQAKLGQAGTALLRFPAKIPGVVRYDIFVSGQRQCVAPQVAVYRRIKTTTGSCQVLKCDDPGRSQRR